MTYHDSAVVDGGTPSTASGTDFGSIASGQSVTRTYTFSNHGTQPLHLQLNTPEDASNAPEFGGFTDDGQILSGTTIPAGQSKDVVFTLNDSGAGRREATYSIDEYFVVDNGTDEVFAGTADDGNFSLNLLGFLVAPAAASKTLPLDEQGAVSVDNSVDSFGAFLSNTVDHQYRFVLPSGLNDLTVRTSASYSGASGDSGTADVTVRIARDDNGNGLLDQSEFEVPVYSGAAVAADGDTAAKDVDAVVHGLTSGAYIVEVAPKVRGESSDANFELKLSAATVVPPAIKVTFGNVVISGDDSTPSTTDGTDFGSVDQNAADEPTRTFTVTNTGGSTLTLGGVTVDDGFDLITTVPKNFAPGESHTFQIGLLTKLAGAKSGQVRFTTNVSGKGEFNFAVSGTVTAVSTPQPDPPPQPPQPEPQPDPEPQPQPQPDPQPDPQPQPEPPPEPQPDPQPPKSQPPAPDPNGLALGEVMPGKFVGPFSAGDKKARGTVAVSFKFNGTPAAAGPANVELYLSSDTTWDANDREVGQLSKAITIKAPKPAKAGKTAKTPKLPRAAKLKVAIPAGTTPGAYFLVARLTGSGVADDGANSAVGGTVVVQAP